MLAKFVGSVVRTLVLLVLIAAGVGAYRHVQNNVPVLQAFQLGLIEIPTTIASWWIALVDFLAPVFGSWSRSLPDGISGAPQQAPTLPPAGTPAEPAGLGFYFFWLLAGVLVFVIGHTAATLWFIANRSRSTERGWVGYKLDLTAKADKTKHALMGAAALAAGVLVGMGGGFFVGLLVLILGLLLLVQYRIVLSAPLCFLEENLDVDLARRVKAIKLPKWSWPKPATGGSGSTGSSSTHGAKSHGSSHGAGPGPSHGSGAPPSGTGSARTAGAAGPPPNPPPPRPKPSREKAMQVLGLDRHTPQADCVDAFHKLFARWDPAEFNMAEAKRQAATRQEDIRIAWIVYKEMRGWHP